MTDLEANKAAISAYFERLLNAGDLAGTSEVFHGDASFHYPLGDLDGAVAIQRYLAAVRQAFPDIPFSMLGLLGEGDLVACRWSMSGTQDMQAFLLRP